MRETQKYAWKGNGKNPRLPSIVGSSYGSTLYLPLSLENMTVSKVGIVHFSPFGLGSGLQEEAHQRYFSVMDRGTASDRMAKVDVSGGSRYEGGKGQGVEKAREWCAVVESSFPPRCEGKSLESSEEWSVLTIVIFINQHHCI